MGDTARRQRALQVARRMRANRHRKPGIQIGQILENQKRPPLGFNRTAPSRTRTLRTNGRDCTSARPDPRRCGTVGKHLRRERRAHGLARIVAGRRILQEAAPVARYSLCQPHRRKDRRNGRARAKNEGRTDPNRSAGTTRNAYVRRRSRQSDSRTGIHQ